MALLLKKMYKGYFWLFEDIADPRANEYFLLSSVFNIIPIAFFYVYFCKKLGPKLMENRKAFDLKYILIVFNLIQVLVNAYVVIEVIRYIPKMGFYCGDIDYSNDPDAIHMLDIVYIFFIMKLSDLLDTVFFILRKKFNQVSFLHVYHHFGMCLGSWVAMKFFGGGATVIIGAVNGFVHCVMYSYYLLTAYDSDYKKSVWWKKHITQIQLVQFLFFIIYYSSFLVTSSCNYPKFIPFLFVPQNFFMLCLFGEFYWRTYIKAKEPKQNK
ncbi:unnamed protein product [Brassicogethes aeneus]|uniref:Elongation of very long chain fatty acids protein n=1 Tax=Brassicogethes aeneus TaxID=1431903 RepID=A0A9P0B5T8_BRAAE|nr:unnamed protein product [Brassicogethes aeneus]